MTLLYFNDTKYATCKHDKGFTLISGKFLRLKYHHVYACNLGCTFFLNFNPKEYPNGVAFLCEANPAWNKCAQDLKRTT